MEYFRSTNVAGIHVIISLRKLPIVSIIAFKKALDMSKHTSRAYRLARQNSSVTGEAAAG